MLEKLVRISGVMCIRASDSKQLTEELFTDGVLNSE